MFEPQRGIGRLSCEVIRLNPYFSPKERLMFVRSSALAVATILAVTALSPTGAFAVRGAFDGSWSVQTATSRGACPSDVRFAVDVRDGVVSAAGLLNISGNVAANLATRVRISAGNHNARATGRLTATPSSRTRQ